MDLRSYQLVITLSAAMFIVASRACEVDEIDADTASGRSGKRAGTKTIGIVETAHRHIRSLSYPPESEMGVNYIQSNKVVMIIFFALAIPLDDPVSTKSVSVAFFFEANYRLTNDISSSEKEDRRIRRSLDRKTLYALLESKFQSLGFPGKQCLLRSICETAREQWNDALREHNGLVGDLMSIIFRPSASADEDLASEYITAEDPELDCASRYQLCPFSIYQYISE